ncbi:MAG: hypothetical protein R6X02_14450 [Enhygromyxa sp.]
MTTLATKIAHAIESGSAPLITIAELLEAPRVIDGPVVAVEVSFADAPLGLESLYRLAALTPGVPIGQWIPNEGVIAPLFGSSVAAVERVTFVLDVEADSLLSISTTVILGKPGGGLTLSVLDQPQASATVERLVFSVSSPLAPPRAVDVQILGSLSFGALSLDLRAAAPALSFFGRQRAGQSLALSDLIDSFGLPLGDRFAGLTLDGLSLDLQARERSGYAEVLIATENGPFMLDPVGVLGLESMTLTIEHAPGGTQATIAANLVVNAKLFVGVLVVADSGAGSWRVAGSLDLPASLRALGKDDSGSVTLDDLATRVFDLPLPAELGSFLSTVGVEALAGSVTLGPGSSTDYSLATTVTVEWQLGGLELEARTAIAVANGDLSIAGEFELGGFRFSLGYSSAAKDSSTLSVSIDALGGLTATYSLRESTIEIGFGEHNPSSFGAMLSGFIAFVTGNEFVQLPPPWDLLDEVTLDPSKLKLSVDLATRAVRISYAAHLLNFFGVSVEGFTLGYDPSKPRGQTLALGLKGDFRVLGAGRDPSFNPEQPSSAPAVPGAGSQLFDVRLAAVGQHVALPDDPRTKAPPTDIEGAVAAITSLARASGDDPSTLPVFHKDAGWLIGGHLVFLGAIDFQLVFADPSIYGVLVEVKPSSSTSPALLALAGLRAEILYRPVSESIGVYEGSLTLPDRIRKIDYGAFQLQLPSLAVAIYTNGDFLVDVGFPHGGDFSRSLIVSAGQYTGAGGVYYGRLSGETATKLPAVPTDSKGAPLGAFGSVTAIGIGVRVGIQRAYSSGPLSARFSVVLQAIFEGLFSTYTQFSPRATEDYFDIQASISIIGQLEGKLDFAIITASVLVRIELTVAARAIARRQVRVPVTARVTVRVSVKIKLGLFSIRIHFSFNATVGFTATFGHDQHALWDGPRAAALGFAEGVGPAKLSFEPPPVGLEALLYVVPQLSRGQRGDQAQWIYTLQLALSAPQALPGTQALAGDGSMFVDFAQLVVAWVANAAYPGDPKATTLAEYYASISLDPDQLEQLSGLLQAARADQSAAPQLDDIQALLGANRFQVQFPTPAPGEEVGLGFFPLLPGSTLSYSQGEGQPIAVEGDATCKAQVLRDYVLMIALQIVEDAKALEPSKVQTLAEIFAALGPAKLSAATALTTRFMLHGTRVATDVATGAPRIQALYELTGQQALLDQLDQLDADVLQMTLSCDEPGAWGLVFPPASGEGDDPQPPAASITLTSANQQLYAPTTIAKLPTTVSEAGVVAGEMPSIATMAERFRLAPGLEGAAATLRRLPRALIGLVQAGSKAKFGLRDSDDQAYAGDYRWATTVAFDLRRVPDPSGASAYLSDTYALAGVQSDGLDALVELYRGQTDPGGGPKLAAVELGWAVQRAGRTRELALVGVEPSTVFLFQRNIATGAEPEPGPAIEIDGRDPLDFLGRLLGAGLAGTEGNYLFLAHGLPAELFDARGLGRVLAVISFERGGDESALEPYYCAVRLATADDAAAELAAVSQTVTTQRATVPPGMIGAQVTRPEPEDDDEDASGYQSSLDNLFNLIAFAPKQLVATAGDPIDVSMALPPAIGPLDPGDTPPGELVHRHVYDLLTLARVPAGDPLADARSPYRFVGGRLSLGFGWIDVFGDSLPAGIGEIALPVTYTDPLTKLGDWPGLVFGFKVEGGGGQPRQLVLESTWVPDNDKPDETLSDAARSQYEMIYHQLAGCTISASSSLTDARLDPASGVDPRAVLRDNIRKILDELDNASEPQPLAPIRFTLPADDAAYHDGLLLPLSATIHFARPADLVDPQFGPEARAAIVGSSSTLQPYHPVIEGEGEGEGASLQSYRAFARDFERAFASMQLKVLAGSLDSRGGGHFFALRWGDRGLDLNLQPASGDAQRGFAPPPFATSLQSREGIAPRVNAKIDSPDFKLPAADLGVSNLDVDAAMGALLRDIERFLAPELGVPAAELAPELVDRCVAAKQRLAGQLSARTVALSEQGPANGEALAAARERYRQACLVSLTNYYAVDAVGVFEVSSKVPSGATLPELAVHGQPRQDQKSEVTVSTGRAAVVAGGQAPLALALSSRNKGWQASYAVPDNFVIESLERVTGSVIVRSSDEAIVAGERQQRRYRTGDRLRFILEEGTSRTLDAPAIELPLRAYPPVPVLRRQYVSPAPIDARAAEGAGVIGPIREAKSWSLDADYRHTFTAQDKLHLTVVLNERPVSVFGDDDAQDLLDALVQLQALAPRISAVFDQQRAGSGDPERFHAAIQAFVALVEYVCDHFEFVPERGAIGKLPPAIGSTWVFTIAEHFSGDPETAPFMADLTCTDAPSDLGFSLPPPALTIAGYHSEVVSSDASSWRYQFRNKSGDLLVAADGIATPERSLAVEPLDVIDWQNGRVHLQIVRNEGLPPVFVYETPVVSARDHAVPFVERRVDIDIAKLPRPDYGAEPPPAGSLLDWIARLYHVVLNGEAQEQSVGGGLRTAVSLTWPPSAGPSSLALPPVRLPVILSLPSKIDFDPSPEQAVALAKPVADALEAWLQAHKGAELAELAALDFELTLFSNASDNGLPLLRLDGLTLALADIAERGIWGSSSRATL